MGTTTDVRWIGKVNQAAMKALHDLKARRRWATSSEGSPVTTNMLCAEIARLNMVQADLLDVLKPFADYASHIAQHHPGWDHDQFTFNAALDTKLSMREFRAAARALEGK